MNYKAKALAAKEKLTLGDLREIMSLLRGEGGCPWDIEQTHASIRQNLIEETYEVAEAIDNNDDALLREELGDLLFQIVFHTRIAEEEGVFTFDDVVDEVARKMIIRHPHIFGDVVVSSVGDVLSNWDEIKKRTKQRKSLYDTLDGVAKTLPALMRAEKLASKLAKAGAEYTPDAVDASAANIGDRLFAIVAEASAQGIDPEKELSDACERCIAQIKSRGNE